MIEKNVIGVYSIREQYPVFKYTDHDEKRIDPNKYGTEALSQINVSKDTISEHEPLNQWRSFSDLLKERKKKSDSESEREQSGRTPTHPDRETASQKEAQKRANQAIQSHILTSQMLPKAASQDALTLSETTVPLTHLQHYLATVQKPVPDEHLKAYETPDDEDDAFADAGSLKLRDVMTRKIVCMMDETTLEQVASLCNQRGISGMPVLNADKKLVGVISMKDVIKSLMYGHDDMELLSLGRELLESRTKSMLQEPVHKFMSEDPVTASPDMPLQKACQLMKYHNIQRLIVTRDGEVKGIFSARDAMFILSKIDLLKDLSEI